jgi:hypothetical protein
MLLSTYLLYRLAGSAKLRSHMLKITVFVLVVSLLPVIFPVTFIIGVTWPVTFLSWPALFMVDPFYRIIEYVPETDEWDIQHATYHETFFLTTKIVTLDWQEFFFTAFSLSLLVNVSGALVGYWVGKKHRIQFFHSKWWRIFWGLVGVALIAGIVVPVLAVPDLAYVIGWHLGYTLIGFGIILLETISLSWLKNFILIDNALRPSLQKIPDPSIKIIPNIKKDACMKLSEKTAYTSSLTIQPSFSKKLS